MFLNLNCVSDDCHFLREAGETWTQLFIPLVSWVKKKGEGGEWKDKEKISNSELHEF